MDPQISYFERSVVIHRDENGFGLRVAGQNPVHVQYVHENGAAWKAGVRPKDRIIKVNGTLVRSYDHQQVVRIIQNCTRFVNLTLHSPEQMVPDSLGLLPGSGMIQNESYNNGLSIGNNNNTDNNTVISNNTKTHPLHQLLHPPHPVTSSSNWLLNISPDLFQDNQHNHNQNQQHQHLQHHHHHHHHNQQQQPQQQQPQQQQLQSQQLNLLESSTPVNQMNHQPAHVHQPTSGISKLIVSGPSPLVHSHSQASILSMKAKSHQNKNQSSTRDNPYYYYKTATDKSLPESKSACNNANLSLTSHQEHQQSSKSGSSFSMVLSRSSSKYARSTISKHKSRSSVQRFVGDFKSLAISNHSQATPSSLSTSPSSSDLSDCDDQDNSSHLDCVSSVSDTFNSSSSTLGAINISANSSSNGLDQSQAGSTQPTPVAPPKTRLTTRRLEIIRELIDTEKTHTERLKHLNDLLYKPMKKEGLVPLDQLKMVFSCHKTLLRIHKKIYKTLSSAQQNIPPGHNTPLIGKALIEIFGGKVGNDLEIAASIFCACQSTNTELLNRFTRKDTKAGEFLAQVANQQMLGRLGIKDLLASCFQRLTKYPLLLENLLKATPSSGVPTPTPSGGMHSKSLSEGAIAASFHLPQKQQQAQRNQTTYQDPGNTTNEIIEEPAGNNDSTPTRQSGASATSCNNTVSQQVSELGTPTSPTPQPVEVSTDEENTLKPSIDDSSSQVSTTPTAQPTLLPTTEVTNLTVAPASDNPELEPSDVKYAHERLYISKALLFSRQILINVNEAVKRAISRNKLRDIWKKTDKVAYLLVLQREREKDEDKRCPLPEIDIEREEMLHEGPLTLRIAKRSLEVQVLLLTHYLVILTREGQDKYKLKFFNPDGKDPAQYSPIFEIDEHLATRDTATDENGFYLICKKREVARMYEFASQSPMDRANWKDKIYMAKSYNYAPDERDDENTLTRYGGGLISLDATSNTPSNIEHHHQHLAAQQHHTHHNQNQLHNESSSSPPILAPNPNIELC